MIGMMGKGRCDICLRTNYWKCLSKVRKGNFILSSNMAAQSPEPRAKDKNAQLFSITLLYKTN